MSFLSKVELKGQLQALGIKVEGNCIRKSELKKILGMAHTSLIKPTQNALKSILELRTAIGKEYKGQSHSGQVPVYLLQDDKFLDEVYKKLNKCLEAYSDLFTKE